MPLAELADVTLYYESRGDGPPVLLICGIPAIVSDWEPVAAGLAGAGYRVIVYDNRGGGGSTVTPGPYTTRQLADDADALLDELEIERAHVFGMSLGGMIAQEVAINHPDRVDRLVLGCTHAGVAHAAPMPRETGRAFAMATDDWAQRMAALAPKAFAPGADPALVEAFVAKKSLDVQDPAGYEAQVQAALSHDAADRLGTIAAPTLVITGDDDQVIPGASSDVLVARIGDARLETVPGSGHLFFIERPDESLAVVTAFLAEGPGLAAA
jgi:pimeloyl-ACP methyl ester carboxylesterase